MARPIVLSNGEMHVGINDYGLVHDLYFPYVGLDNHTIGKGLRHKVGVMVDDQLSWLDDGGWHLEFSYPHQSLIGHTIARNEKLAVTLEFDDAVDSYLNVFMRNIHVINNSNHARHIKLFMHQAFVIGDSRGNTDTAQYLPENDSIMHYRGKRIFIISGESGGKSFDQHTVGLFGIEGREGTWRDAEDGDLSGCDVEHGRVDSVIRFSLDIDSHSSERVHYWIAAGTTLRAALSGGKAVKDYGMASMIERTAASWHKWLAPTLEVAEKVPKKYQSEFILSAMMLKAHTDKRGAVIASTDSAMLNHGRDNYAYSWPRDAAYVLWPLVRLGYKEEATNYFDFCRRVIHPKGYLSHKYRADGALGSSWHPYTHDSRVSPPIQTDETALVLFLIAQFYEQNKSDKFLAEYYDSLVMPMADFLNSFIDPETKLPEPSYDLWEENYMVATYTVAITQAALLAAAELAEAANHQQKAVAWRSSAEQMQTAARSKLFSQDRQAFRKGLKLVDGEYVSDDTIDVSATFGAFMFGLYDSVSSDVKTSFESIKQRFDTDNNVALPRYENDTYYRPEGEISSNYWNITSLWRAQYCLEQNDVAEAETILDWVLAHSYDSGVIAEQVIPATEYSASVAPLTWSHAEFMATILDLVATRKQN